MDMKILLKCVHIGNMASSMALTTKSNWCEWQRNIQNILVRKLSSLIIYAYTNLFILHRAGILPPIPKEIDFTNPPHVHVCMHRTSILSSLPHILPNIVNKLVYIAYFIVLWIAVLFSRLSFPYERYALDKIYNPVFIHRLYISNEMQIRNYTLPAIGTGRYALFFRISSQIGWDSRHD